MSAPPAKRRRKELNLSDKIKLIKEAESSSLTMKKLGEKYNIGKSTVSDIIKKKDEYVAQFEANADANRQRLNHSAKFHDVNALTWDWFQQARAKNIPISGPLLQEKALSFANSLQIHDFKASNGWLESWRSRYNVRSLKVSGERADVSDKIVDEFWAFTHAV
ncbi:tigger transposable element-derived protein 4-like [Ptychodera flava]|uniref:tigger transposable element-derived protein 4-like n=1 Tax=Ptychodera flava TaxID=63121 RepID=UPI003969CD96